MRQALRLWKNAIWRSMKPFPSTTFFLKRCHAEKIMETMKCRQSFLFGLCFVKIEMLQTDLPTPTCMHARTTARTNARTQANTNKPSVWEKKEIQKRPRRLIRWIQSDSDTLSPSSPSSSQTKVLVSEREWEKVRTVFNDGPMDRLGCQGDNHYDARVNANRKRRWGRSRIGMESSLMPLSSLMMNQPWAGRERKGEKWWVARLIACRYIYIYIHILLGPGYDLYDIWFDRYSDRFFFWREKIRWCQYIGHFPFYNV